MRRKDGLHRPKRWITSTEKMDYIDRKDGLHRPKK
jgi:hypothetical protein